MAVAGFAIAARALHSKSASLAKALPLSFLIVTLLSAVLTQNLRLGRSEVWPFILAGLCCGLAGDVFLLQKSRYFKQGIIAFLLGHLLYIAGFSRVGPFSLPAAQVLLPLALYAAIYLGLLFKLLLPRHIKHLPIALAYALSILAMSFCACIADFQLHAQGLLSLFFPAALLFTVSDGILAYRVFGRYTRLADSLVLITYYCAQGLIVLSLFIGVASLQG